MDVQGSSWYWNSHSMFLAFLQHCGQEATWYRSAHSDLDSLFFFMFTLGGVPVVKFRPERSATKHNGGKPLQKYDQYSKQYKALLQWQQHLYNIYLKATLLTDACTILAISSSIWIPDYKFWRWKQEFADSSYNYLVMNMSSGEADCSVHDSLCWNYTSLFSVT